MAGYKKKIKRKIKKQTKVELVNKFDDKDFFDDCALCQFTKTMQNKGRQPTVSELKKVFDNTNKKMKEREKHSRVADAQDEKQWMFEP